MSSRARSFTRLLAAAGSGEKMKAPNAQECRSKKCSPLGPLAIRRWIACHCPIDEEPPSAQGSSRVREAHAPIRWDPDESTRFCQVLCAVAMSVARSQEGGYC